MNSPAAVYIETSVISYLAARPSRDLLVAAHQQITSDWWTRSRPKFRVFVSGLVIREISAGDTEAAARRQSFASSLPLLDLSPAALELAERLLADCALPREAMEDSVHIAVAAVHGIEYLLTWNCKHIANATMRQRIESTCADAGYQAPIICTPEQLMQE